MTKKSLRISLMSIGGTILATSTIASSIVLTSCSNSEAQKNTVATNRKLIGFNAKVQSPKTYANSSRATDTTNTTVVLDPAANLNAINDYNTLLKSLSVADIQNEFDKNLVQFFQANEFEQESGKNEIEAEVQSVKVNKIKYNEPTTTGELGSIEVQAKVTYLVEQEVNGHDKPDQSVTKDRTITLKPSFAGKNEITYISQQLKEYSKQFGNDDNAKDAIEDLAEIYFGDRDDKDFDLDDIFESFTKQQSRQMFGLTAREETANGESQGSQTPAMTALTSQTSLSNNNQVTFTLNLTGTNLPTDLSLYKIAGLDNVKWALIGNPSNTNVSFNVTVSATDAANAIGKPITVTTGDVSKEVTLSAINIAAPTVTIKNNVNRSDLDNVSKDNIKNYVDITYPSNTAAKDFNITSATGNKSSGKITVGFEINNNLFTFNNNQKSTSVASSNTVGLPNVSAPGKWEDSKGVLNYLNNFINNVSPYAKMAGWTVNLTEVNYQDSQAKAGPAVANPLEELWVPSLAINAVYYPTLIDNLNSDSSLQDISGALNDNDNGIDLAFNMQKLSQKSLTQWFQEIFTATPDNALDHDKATWTTPNNIKTIMNNLKNYDIQIPAKSINSITYDGTDWAKEKEIEIEIHAGNTTYELEVQASFFASIK